MERWFGIGEVPGDLPPSVVTIGNFDGVHRGHASVLGQVVAESARRSAPAVAVTFDPHPRQVLDPERAPQVITPLPQRLDLLAETGLAAVLVQPFTRELAAQTPEQYVAETFVATLRATAVVIGADVRFGVRNSGDVTTLRRLGQQHGFDVVVLEDVGSPVQAAPTATGATSVAGGPLASGGGNGGPVVPPGERRLSSTWVRELLARGDVAGAARVLGRPHRLDGVVVHGDHRGRELGYPTANLAADPERAGQPGEPAAVGLVPADGVYAGWLVDLDDPAGTQRHPAAVSIGTNPQFGGSSRRVEAYVLDRDDLELYGHRVRVELVERLRGIERFAGVAELVAQMARDVDQCRELLGVQVVPGEQAEQTGQATAGRPGDG